MIAKQLSKYGSCQEDMDVRCRICLDPSTRKDIFSSTITCNGIKITCQDVMIKIFSLSVSKNDGLPTKICLKCYSKLSSAFKFKNKADESYILLLDSILKKDAENDRIVTEDQAFLKIEAKLNTPNILSNENNSSLCNDDNLVIDKETTDKKEFVFNDSVEDIENVPLIEFVKKEVTFQDPQSPKKSKLIIKKPIASSTKLKSRTITKHKKLKRAGKKTPSTSKLEVCNICGKEFRQLKEHMIKHRVDRKVLKCEYCPKTFVSYHGRKKHTAIEHLGELYFCEICQKHYKSGSEHVRLRHNNLPSIHQCLLCTKNFTTPNELKWHATTHSKEKPYLCPVCGKAFRTKILCINHRRCVHDLEKKFICQYCSKSFFSKGSLKKHIRSHTGERTYECKQCEKKYINNSALRNHELTHLGIKKEKCELCDKRFLNKGALSTHMITHSKVKNHECRYCGVKFGRSDHRNRHEKTAHENAIRIEPSKILLKEL